MTKTIQRKVAKMQRRPKLIKIKVRRADGIPAFGAWMSCKDENCYGHKTILLNLEAHFAPQIYGNNRPAPLMTPKECVATLIETMMHEFGHALQQYFGRKFSERQIERIVKSYRDKIHD